MSCLLKVRYDSSLINSLSQSLCTLTLLVTGAAPADSSVAVAKQRIQALRQVILDFDAAALLLFNGCGACRQLSGGGKAAHPSTAAGEHGSVAAMFFSFFNEQLQRVH